MAEENVPDNVPVLTEIEQKASTQGWVPQDQWEGDPEAWRPAKEFLDRGELFKKIDEQNRTIKEFKKTLDQFAKHHEKVKESEYKRALEDLRAAKKEALIEGDADKVIDIEERIDLVKEAQRVPTPQVAPEINPVFTAWVEKNGWYETNKAMRAYADRIGTELGAEGGRSASDILSEVERQVKQEFAHKFQNPRRQAAAAVEGEGGKGRPVKEVYEASAEERRVAERMARSVPGMTVEKYLGEIADMKKRGVY